MFFHSDSTAIGFFGVGNVVNQMFSRKTVIGLGAVGNPDGRIICRDFEPEKCDRRKAVSGK